MGAILWGGEAAFKGAATRKNPMLLQF